MNKVIIALCLFGVALSAPQGQLRAANPQLTQEEIEFLPEPYNFGHQVSDDETTNYQTRQESQDANGVVTGEYSWVAPNGIRYITAYTADKENGFQVKTTEEQTNIVVIIPEPQPRFQQVQLLPQ